MKVRPDGSPKEGLELSDGEAVVRHVCGCLDVGVGDGSKLVAAVGGGSAFTVVAAALDDVVAEDVPENAGISSTFADGGGVTGDDVATPDGDGAGLACSALGQIKIATTAAPLNTPTTLTIGVALRAR